MTPENMKPETVTLDHPAQTEEMVCASCCWVTPITASTSARTYACSRCGKLSGVCADCAELEGEAKARAIWPTTGERPHIEWGPLALAREPVTMCAECAARDDWEEMEREMPLRPLENETTTAPKQPMKAGEPTNEWTTDEQESIEITYRQQIPGAVAGRGGALVVRCPRDDAKLDVYFRRVPEGTLAEFPEVTEFLEFACAQCRRSFRVEW
jgi:hypothetical protein